MQLLLVMGSARQDIQSKSVVGASNVRARRLVSLTTVDVKPPLTLGRANAGRPCGSPYSDVGLLVGLSYKACERGGKEASSDAL